jgi:hypothetical protein
MTPANTMHAQTINDPTAPAVRDLFRAVCLVLDVEHMRRKGRPLARDPMPELLAAARALGWRPIGEGADE